MEEEELEAPITLSFRGSDGKEYKTTADRLKELKETAQEEGVTLELLPGRDLSRKNEESAWEWKHVGAGVKSIWDDPTGEHGALAYMGLNALSGLGTAAGRVFKGIAQGVGDVGFGLARGIARGVETLAGADGHAVSGFLKDWHESYGEIVDFLTPDIFEKRGMYDGIEGAAETMGAINNFAEAVFGLKGMGMAAKGATAAAGLADKGATAGKLLRGMAAKAPAVGQAVTAAGMGGKGYAEMAEDPEGPGGWRQEVAAAAKGGVEAAMFGVLGPFKKMNMALPKPFEQLTKMEVVKRFTGEALKSGLMMGGVAAAKEGAEALATAGTDEHWHQKTAWEVAKTVMTEFAVGSAFHVVNAAGKTGEWLKWRSDRQNGEGALSFRVEQNRKIYAPRLDQQARLALAANEQRAVRPEGTDNVAAILPGNGVRFDDGSVWQLGTDGRATITVADGTILDAQTGAVAGYRARREAAAKGAEEGKPENEGGRAENATLLLDALERGELPTQMADLEGLEITETSYQQGHVLDGEWEQAKAPPVIIWVGNDGTRELETGRSRAAAAAASGAKQIKAHVIREDQGWTREQARALDAVENMREGRGTREEIARGVDALGIRSVEDCDRFGIVPERPVLDAIEIANEGSEALRGAAADGTVGVGVAGIIARKLGKKALGSAAERAQATALDMIAGKLPPEEASAAMDAIAELAARKPMYTDREAAEAIRAARERAVGRVAVAADSEMVEMPDGSIKSVAEAKAEGAREGQEGAAEAARSETGERDRAAEPEVKKDGTVGCARFPLANARRTRSEDGREILFVEGITGEEMMLPQNREAAVQFLTRLKEMAGDVDVTFAEVSAADAAEALLMAARMKEMASRPAEEPNELVQAGQRLVDGLFGEGSGIRVRSGTEAERMEAAKAAVGKNAPVELLKDAEGEVKGYWHRGNKEVVLFEGADAGTLAHEIGWHAVRQWAETNSPDLLLKMRRYAARAPKELKKLIEEAYGDFDGDALMDEIGARRFEEALGEKFQKLLAKNPEVRGWWRKVLHALARAWKGLARTVGGNRIDLKKLEKMSPEEAIEKLAEQMLEGRRLGEGFAAGEGKRASIAGEGAARNMGIKGAGDAEAMEKAGKDREEIWRKTGWWRAKDGKWRFEMPSTKMKDARELYSALIEGNNETKLEKILEAPELFKAYPQLRDTKIILSPEIVNPGEAAGWYDRIKNEIVLLDAGLVSLKDMPARERDLRDTYQKVLDSDEFVRRRFADMDAFGIEHGTVEEEREYARWWIERQDKGINRTNEARIRDLANDRKVWSVFGKIIHEVQHAVQHIEGFATGASGDEEGYSRFTGEVEARNAARREAMSPEERAATPPWATEDVPADRQIIRFSRSLAPEERPEGTEERREKVNTTLRRLEEIQRLKKEGTADFYKKVNEEFGADYTFDLGTPYGMLGEFLEAKPVQLKMRTLLRKKKESYKSHHPFTFEEAQDVVTNINEPAMILTRQNDRQGVRAFYEANTGRIFCVSVRPSGEVYDVETLYPKEVQRLVGLLKTLRGRKEDVLGVDVLKAISMFERQYDTTQPEQANGLADAISILKQIAEGKGEKGQDLAITDDGKVFTRQENSASSQADVRDNAEGTSRTNAESIPQQGGGAQGEIRPSIKKRDEVYEDVLKAVRAGSVRVAAGKSERTEAGFDAGANLYLEREGQAGPSQDGSMTLAYSEALRVYRALAASAHMPKVLEKMPWLAARDRKGRLKLNAAAFGIVDRSDMEAVKESLRKDGMFKHEDAEWRLRNDSEEVRAMEQMSNLALQEEMQRLAEARISGKMSGGGRTAVNILAKEIGRLVCELPATEGAPKSLKDLRALGKGIAKELGDPKGELGKEAREAAKWWREQEAGRTDRTAVKSTEVTESELWAEMFGMFLADPVGLEAHAPKVYEKMVEAIAGNEKLSEAWNALRRTRDAEGPHERVMRDIERQWQANEQAAYKELLAELQKPIGSRWKRMRARLMLEMHSTEGPAVMWVTDAVKDRLAELKRLKKEGKIGEGEYETLAGGAQRELEKMRVALLHKQRGGATGRLYALEFAERIMGDVARDGVDMGDLRRYLHAKNVRDGLHQQGKAAALGMDQREADMVLRDLETRLGADGWAKLETAAKRFQALREQHILENEFVQEAFGKELVGYWKMNASYVRSERTWTAEEVAAYEAARKDWMERHPGESDVIGEIEALMDMHVAKGSGTAGSAFLKPLVGSHKAVKDPLAATLENDLRIVEFAQRNHWACQLAECAEALKMDGFTVMEDRGGGGRLRGSERYGSVSFLKDGKRMTLVMPKVVAEGFEHDSKGVSKLVKLNRWASAILTQYSLRFAWRNIIRNRESNNNNIAWMSEGRVVTALGAAGMRPIARWGTFLMEQAAAHLPDRFSRNMLVNLFYGKKTNMYWIAEATRLAKMMQDPRLIRQRAEEADRLAAQGKTAQAQKLMEDVQKCREFMKLPIFAGVRKQIMGESGKTDLDELMRTLGMETNFDGTKLKGMQRVKRWMQRRAETIKRYNDFEEARVKLVALLAAQHEAELARAQGREAPRSKDEITYQVATMSGSPRYENRGRAMNYIEFACGPFMNVGMKGAWRTVESMRYDPRAWWTKAAGRIAGRLATSVLWMGGGYKVLAEMLREAAEEDEEKKKTVDGFERFGRRMAHALANCSDYRLRNYDLVPVGLYGKWSTLAISMPRGDEDRLLMPTVDLLAHGLLGSERAQEAGFTLPTDLNYTAAQAIQNMVLNSGLVPDLTRRGLLMSLFQDAIGPIVGWNPYNSFTQRTVYDKGDFDSRYADPGNMAAKVGKQLWNDIGGQVLMPATTWDEDEGAYEDQGQWAYSFAEEDEAGCMPIGGKTIFKALHSIPFLSAAASGLVTMQNGGNAKIARRLEQYRRDENAPMRAVANRVATEVLEAVRTKGQDWDYSEMLEARVAGLGLPEEDAAIIEAAAFRKVQEVAKKMGSEFDPIGKALTKMAAEEKKYKRALRQVEAEGWDGDLE